MHMPSIMEVVGNVFGHGTCFEEEARESEWFHEIQQKTYIIESDQIE